MTGNLGLGRYGVRLRLMAVLIALFCGVYCISMGFYNVGRSFNERDRIYTEAYEMYALQVGVWDWIEAESSYEEAVGYLGERPIEPVRDVVSFPEIYEGLAGIFVVMIVSIFLCSVLVFCSYVCFYLDNKRSNERAPTIAEVDAEIDRMIAEAPAETERMNKMIVKHEKKTAKKKAVTAKESESD